MAPLPISENPLLFSGDANKVIQTPVETAIRHLDPVIYLLVGLGASLDVAIRESYETTWSSKASLLEAVEAMNRRVDKELERLQKIAKPESMDVDPAGQPEWKTWIIKLNQVATDLSSKGKKKQQDNKRINELTRMKVYLEEVLGLLKEKKAKTWNQLHPDAERKEIGDMPDAQQKPADPFFKVWASDWWPAPVLQEKVPLYEELYEACWNGDDDKIRELCLPPPQGTTRKVAPIQIVCRAEGGGPRLGLMFVSSNAYATVYRVHPVACCDPSSSLVHSEDCPDNRCRSAEDKARAHHDHCNFQHVGHQTRSAGSSLPLVNPADNPPLVDDLEEEESEAEESVDGSGDDSDEKEEPKFIDLDQQDTQVRYDVGPEKLLGTATVRLPDTEDGTTCYLKPLEQAVYDDDFEAFIQIAELGAQLPKPISLTELTSEDTLLRKDRAKLLDEYIRRTGQGIDVPQKTEGTEDAPQRPKGKEYWGLNVHGKKRRDLAARGDPNARHNWSKGSKFPLVWLAAQHGALGILEYLNTDRPLAAYKYHFSANAKEAKNADLPAMESSISELLGWCFNPSNETALSAALHFRRLDSFKKLLELNSTLLKPYLHMKYVPRVL
jgi:hypothetical protein